jgi:hypothetical protein
VNAETTLYRSREQARLVFLFCAGFSLMLVFGAVLPSRAPGGARLAWLVASLGVGFAYWFRLRLVGVTVDDKYVTIVNPRRTRVVPLSDVDHVAVGRGAFFPRIGLLFLRDGSRVGIWAIQSVWNPLIRPSDRGAHDVVDELNAALRVDRREAA